MNVFQYVCKLTIFFQFLINSSTGLMLPVSSDACTQLHVKTGANTYSSLKVRWMWDTKLLSDACCDIGVKISTVHKFQYLFHDRTVSLYSIICYITLVGRTDTQSLFILCYKNISRENTKCKVFLVYLKFNWGKYSPRSRKQEHTWAVKCCTTDVRVLPPISHIQTRDPMWFYMVSVLTGAAVGSPNRTSRRCWCVR